MDNLVIRPIQPEDNHKIAAIIRGVFDELDAPKTGTAYADPVLDRLSTAYEGGKSVYYIALLDGEVVAGAGIAPLENGSDGVCELQKMYASAGARGRGVGSKLMEACLKAATDFGYRQCYLETLPYMQAAQRLYAKYGFQYLDAPMGNTGHSSCPVWMLKELPPQSTTREALLIKQYKKYFTEALIPIFGSDEAESFFHIALEEIHGLRRVDLIMNPDIALNDSQKERWDSVVAQLLEQKPIQYIFGKAHFYGLEFKVTENTLIPRPETEELVEWIIHENKNRQDISILDIGTGSGCIAISLAANLEQVAVSALDVSAEALAVAKENATVNNVTVTFIQEDILIAQALPQQYDIIVSNPPYVRHLEKQEIKPNVLNYEPHLALFVEDGNPLIFYRKIAKLAKVHLRKGGTLYFEINQYLGPETVQMLEDEGFKNIILRKDLYGNDRMISAGTV